MCGGVCRGGGGGVLMWWCMWGGECFCLGGFIAGWCGGGVWGLCGVGCFGANEVQWNWVVVGWCGWVGIFG